MLLQKNVGSIKINGYLNVGDPQQLGQADVDLKQVMPVQQIDLTASVTQSHSICYQSFLPM